MKTLPIINYHQLKYIVRLVLALLCLIVNTGCAPNAATAGSQTPKVNKDNSPATVGTARIIIKFTEETPDPSGSDFIKKLSKDLGVSLHYLRPMLSGGAHVFIVEGLSDSNRLVDVIKHLSERSDVVYAEYDGVMHYQ